MRSFLFSLFALLGAIFVSPAVAQPPAGCVCRADLVIQDPTSDPNGCWTAGGTHSLNPTKIPGVCNIGECPAAQQCEFKFHVTWWWQPTAGNPCGITGFEICTTIYDPPNDPGTICTSFSTGIDTDEDLKLNYPAGDPGKPDDPHSAVGLLHRLLPR